MSSVAARSRSRSLSRRAREGEATIALVAVTALGGAAAVEEATAGSREARSAHQDLRSRRVPTLRARGQRPLVLPARSLGRWLQNIIPAVSATTLQCRDASAPCRVSVRQCVG